MTDHVLQEKSGGVLTLTLNRPEKKNALTRAMYQALGDAIDNSADDRDLAARDDIGTTHPGAGHGATGGTAAGAQGR